MSKISWLKVFLLFAIWSQGIEGSGPKQSLCHVQWNSTKTKTQDSHCALFRHFCKCLEGYIHNMEGKCTKCAHGYIRNERNHCVRCPTEGEVWCPYLNKCECDEHHYREDEKDKCIACGKNEQNNGENCKCKEYYTRDKNGVCERCELTEYRDPQTKKCKCSEEFGRNSTGDCVFVGFRHRRIYNATLDDYENLCEEGQQENAEGQCITVTKQYGPVAITMGVIAAGFLGFSAGYVIQQYLEKYNFIF